MRIFILIFIILTLTRCSSTDQPNKLVSTSSDSTSLKKSAPYDFYEHALKALKEKKWDNRDTARNKLRFIYWGAFEGPLQFYQVNIEDSVLIKKLFYCDNVVGDKLDTLLSVDTFKFNSKDVQKLDWLIEKSMIWSLEEKDKSPKRYLDCNGYIFEALRPKDKYFINSDSKTYCFVGRYCPQNSDYINLGEFLKSKAGVKNHYRD